MTDFLKECEEFFSNSFEEEFTVENTQEPSFLTKTNQKMQKIQDTQFTENFDYKHYIDEQMAHIKAEDLEPNVKKKLIQKIRNRMSAQRSRLRKKHQMSSLEEENKSLKDLIIQYQQKIIELQEENNQLKIQLQNHKPSFEASSTDESQNNKIFNIERSEVKSNNSSFFNNSILYLACIIGIIMFSSVNFDNDMVKVGGMLPLIRKIDSNKVKLYEETCEQYCYQNCPNLMNQQSTEMQLYKEKDDIVLKNGIKVTDVMSLICVDPQKQNEDKFVFFNKNQQDIMDSNDYIYVPHFVGFNKTQEITAEQFQLSYLKISKLQYDFITSDIGSKFNQFFMVFNHSHIPQFAGSSFIFFSKNLRNQRKLPLLFTILILLVTFLAFRKQRDKQIQRFVEIPLKKTEIFTLIDSQQFKLEILNQNNTKISLLEDIQISKKKMSFYYNTNEIKEIILSQSMAMHQNTINIKYTNPPENWKQFYPQIMQAIKKDFENFIGKGEKLIVLEGLSWEMYENDFIDLLLLFFNNKKTNFNIIILENSKKNFEYVQKQYPYLNTQWVQNLDPEYFKTTLMNLILNSKINTLTDIQAAKKASEIYKKKGASLNEIFKLYNDYYSQTNQFSIMELQQAVNYLSYLDLKIVEIDDKNQNGQKIAKQFSKDVFLCAVHVKKYNEMGWKNNRLIILTKTQLINSDSKIIKSQLCYSHFNVVFIEAKAQRVIILNIPGVENTTKYYLELSDNFENFVYLLQIYSQMWNPKIKYFNITDPQSNYLDLFYKKPEKLYDYMIESKLLVPKYFPIKIPYMIKHESFLKSNFNKSNVVYYQDPEFTCSLENFEICQCICNKPNYFIFKAYNSVREMYCVFKIFKKWTISASVKNNDIFKQIFSQFTNKERFLKINSIVENQAFLFLVQDFLVKGNFYDFIYSSTKKLFTEEEMFYIVNELLKVIDSVHSQGKTLFCIEPDNLYFFENTFLLSHLNSTRFLQLFDQSEEIRFNIYYASPRLIKEKIISQEIDYWQLGILMYECLYGVTPFQQDSQEETKNLILNANIHFPPKKIRKVSNEAKNFISFLLNKEDQFRKTLNVELVRNQDWLKNKESQITQLNILNDEDIETKSEEICTEDIFSPNIINQ